METKPNISDVINFLELHAKENGIQLNDGASNELITQVENVWQVRLPTDLIKFYKFSNGFQHGEDIFYVIKLEEIIENKIRWKEPTLYIAEYSIYCNVWKIKIDPINNSNYSIFNIDGLVLTHSFAEFLTRFFNKGLIGLYDWNNEVSLNS